MKRFSLFWNLLLLTPSCLVLASGCPELAFFKVKDTKMPGSSACYPGST